MWWNEPLTVGRKWWNLLLSFGNPAYYRDIRLFLLVFFIYIFGFVLDMQCRNCTCLIIDRCMCHFGYSTCVNVCNKLKTVIDQHHCFMQLVYLQCYIFCLTYKCAVTFVQRMLKIRSCASWLSQMTTLCVYEMPLKIFTTLNLSLVGVLSVWIAFLPL